jgi:hypothetical protein
MHLWQYDNHPRTLNVFGTIENTLFDCPARPMSEYTGKTTGGHNQNAAQRYLSRVSHTDTHTSISSLHHGRKHFVATSEKGHDFLTGRCQTIHAKGVYWMM